MWNKAMEEAYRKDKPEKKELPASLVEHWVRVGDRDDSLCDGAEHKKGDIKFG